MFLQYTNVFKLLLTNFMKMVEFVKYGFNITTSDLLVIPRNQPQISPSGKPINFDLIAVIIWEGLDGV